VVERVHSLSASLYQRQGHGLVAATSTLIHVVRPRNDVNRGKVACFGRALRHAFWLSQEARKIDFDPKYSGC
jgi:hypothetical protein